MEMELKPATQSTYGYFDRSYRIELAIFMVFGPILITLWAVAGHLYYYNGYIWPPLLQSATYLTVTLVFVLIFYGNARAARRAGAVVVGREQIVKKGAGAVRVLNCADIRSVRAPRNPLFARSMILESAQKSMRLPLSIRDGHEMVEKVFVILEERGLSFDGAAGLKARLCGAAKRISVLHALRTGHLRDLARAAVAAAIFNSGVASLYWDRGLLPVLIWGFVNMLFQAVAYFATERVHVKKQLAGEDDGTFARYYALSGVIALFVGMAVGILLTEPA